VLYKPRLATFNFNFFTLGSNDPCIQLVLGFLPRYYSCCTVKLTSHLQLVSRLLIRGAIPPNPQKLWWRVRKQLFPESVHSALPKRTSVHFRPFARPSRIVLQITLITRAVFHIPAPYRGPELVVTLPSPFLSCYHNHEVREP
jgi:hypothetical protein